MTTTAKECSRQSASPLRHASEQEAWENGIGVSSTHSRKDTTVYCDKELLTRPILVGYAFGPKKMSTMGVVMAEASQTNLSSVSTTVLVEEAEEDDLARDDEAADAMDPEQVHPSSKLHCQQQPLSTPHNPSPRRKKSADNNNNNNIMLSLGSYSGGLNNIVRYLHSSCSSVDTNSTTTTLLTTGTTVAGGVTPSSTSTTGKLGASISGRSSCGGESQHYRRLRVSFVPLDPDLPLEGQHGAKMDIVLHKLTEDILCLSRYAPLYSKLVPSLGETNGQLEQTLKELRYLLPNDARAAIMRVHRLMRYQKKYPDCWLADDPAKVLILMSRSDIANALAGCLVGVKSASGIPVASPRFLVWDHKQMEKANANPQTMAKCLRDAQITYPLIAKPLQAAGTKTSHYMTVLLHESSLEHVQDSPCLLQEYANHDAVLFKVYVLGNNVRVYQRPSLPNLPPLDFTNEKLAQCPSYVDFDSQRPYPRLSAFGVKEDNDSARPYLSSIARRSSSSPSLTVTAEEVQPIVDTLKKAFGLELFGFDILITSTGENEGRQGENRASERQMLVVDVNYFPSYKEVNNFPSLLAQYLTQRAIDRRRQEPPQTQAEDTSEGEA
jgi:inositol-1,3,4-trisphosphate 5/6-kinase / inositol-tetrakisphosphate 1-kinase